MDNVASAASSYFSAVVLVAYILTAPTVYALSPLSTEEHRRVPAIAAMATFSPLAITGYTMLAIVTSYSLIRLYHFVKSYVLSSAAEATLPQPVSAGRVPYYPFYSPFTFIRSRKKFSRDHNSARNRWSPFCSIFRRLTRPSSPLHLSGAELLPTSRPDSPSAHFHSLIDLPVISVSSSGPVSQHQTSPFKPMKQLSKASSMDTLPSYRPLTPVFVSLPGQVALPPPSTPPPPSPTPLAGMTKTDIQLVPITPQTRRYTPMISTSPSDSSTLPLADTFPAISLSPPNSTAIPSSINPGGPRSSTSNPSLFLSSRTLSSLSLSPRSLYVQQQHKRSKSLGGVAVKRVPPKSNSTALWECENMADSDVSVGHAQPYSLDRMETADDLIVGKSAFNKSPTEYSKFHLNFSSSSSSSTSYTSRSSESLSPSPLTANSESALSSAPLRTPRTLSSASHSPDDIAKPSKNGPLLSRPIPLVDTDINTDTDVALGYGVNEKVSGWGFDTEEPIPVAHILEDFDDMFDSTPLYAKAPILDSMINKEKGVDLEEMDRDMDENKIGEDAWKWDEDIEDEMDNWQVDTGVLEEDTEPVLHLESERETSDGTISFALPPADEILVDEIPKDKTEADFAERGYPSLEMPRLLETNETLLPLLSEPVLVPVISICTEDDVLARKDSGFDSGMASASSIDGATPVSLSQIPTPPASPPRELRTTPLPKNLPGQTLNSSAMTSSVTEPHVITVDIEAQEEKVWCSTSDAHQPDEVMSTATDVSLVHEAIGVRKTAPFFDRPLVSSPASLSNDLPESDAECEFTFSFEAEGDGLGVSAPVGMVSGWVYDTDEEQQEPEIDVQFSSSSSDAVGGWSQEMGDERTAQDLEEPFVNDDARSMNKALASESIKDSITQVEIESVSSSAPAQPTSSSAAGTSREDTVSTLVAAAVLASQGDTSLPGSFPEAASSSIPKSIPESTQDNFSPPQPQRRRRTRTPLEEAIARTRSPLEVALAMQLRPGLGPSADPAWMVRFMMVMWGWVFGLSLGVAEA